MTFTEELGGGIFRCPVCQISLARKGSSLVCQSRHTFDIAAKGYTNLLRGAGGVHGDNKDMVKARRAFLEKGYYAHLKEAVGGAVKRYLPKGGILLDSGCGEGYYTEAFTQEEHLSVYGIDISSSAASLSARTPNICGVAVASAYDLPVKDASCDALVSIFAPFSKEEFLRVLKPGGYFFNVIPAERHLFELKQVIYDTPYENELAPLAIDGFTHLETVSVERVITLPCREDIASLLMMTPYFYRTSRVGHERAEALQKIDVTASFYILIYRKSDT